MLYGILWDLALEKLPDVVQLYADKKVVMPDGLKIVGKWLYNGTKCIEVVEVEDSSLVTEYTGQFDEYGSYTVVELTDAREAIPGLVF